MANFYKAFIKMQNDPAIKVIPIIISSYGGSVYSLLPMLDLIEASGKPVATIALGKAMSCGAVLLASGTKGYRYCAPNADVLVHEVSSFNLGKTSEVSHEAKQTERLNRLLLVKLEQYSRKPPGWYEKEIAKRKNLDWYISAKEARRYGLVDIVSVPNIFRRIC